MRKWISLWIAAVCLICLMVPTASAAEVVASGSCGENLTWTLDDDGVLNISGNGAMTDYSSFSEAPWYSIRSSITAVNIGDSVTTIGDYAFHWCDSLSSVTIGDGVLSIGNYAFHWCDSLENVTIPDGVVSIGNYAFYSCDNLKNVTIGDSVVTIGERAFYWCENLNSVIIGDSVATIGNYAFYWCGSLKSVMIPDSVITIGEYAFRECGSLTGIYVNGDNPKYSSDSCGVLYSKQKTTLIQAPGAIGGSYVIPDSVEVISDCAFYECGNLNSVTIGNSVTEIGDWAFSRCDSLSEITFRGNAPSFGSFVFNSVTANVYYLRNNSTWTSDKLVDYGGTITWVPYPTLTEIASGWSGATQWILTDDGVLTIYGEGNMRNYDYDGGQPWQRYADEITAVVIEQGVATVGSGAFKGLTELEAVILPETGLTKIGEAAFYGCTSLKEIDIPYGLYTINDYTFKNCFALEFVHLPKSLVKIGQGAFENCTALDYIYIPGDTEIIGSWSFKGCTGLVEADMQWADATEIREGAFKNCSSLTNIILPSNIQKLGDSCFYGIGATSFTVPETVTSVEPWCFARASIEEITFLGNAPTIGEGAFNKIALTAYYPGDNTTWTSDIMQNYGGDIVWKAN